MQDRALVLLREELNRIDEEENPYGTRLEATGAAYVDAVFKNRFFIAVLLRAFASRRRPARNGGYSCENAWKR
jgi:hypothetical protein